MACGDVARRLADTSWPTPSRRSPARRRAGSGAAPGRRRRTRNRRRLRSRRTVAMPTTTNGDGDAGHGVTNFARMTALPRNLLVGERVRRRRLDASRSPALDALDLAAEFGTPLFVYDEDDLRSPRSRRGGGLRRRGRVTRPRRSCARRWRASPTKKACASTSRRRGRCTSRSRPGVPADRLVLHGNNKSDDELARALDIGVGSHHRRQLRRDRPARARSWPTGPTCTPRVLIRVTPGVEAHTHEYVMTGQEDSKFGFSFASGAAADAVDRLRGLPVRPRRASTPTSAARSSAPTGFEQEVAVLADLVSSTGVEELCIGGGLGVAYVEHEEGPTIAQWGATVQRPRPSRRASRPSVRITAEPGRSIVAPTAVTLYTVGTIKHLPGIRTYVAVDGGMSDNPRPVLYGSGYETFLPRCVDADRDLSVTLVGKHCESGDVIVRDARCPADTRRSATSSRRRSPAPTATRWRRTTTRCPARRWCSCGTATPASWCAARPSTTCCASTSTD